eukprot:TRINITY_DN1656_c0_g3_i1.p2 TRINITY_DN1656_c0_g3~~TRINITY_DN1656_c0_g3_i1.p2  ORF type:complete len:127 (+),score=32.25 TRINITY_DN1656_c0_g3_i1:184-564(+)
MHIRLKLRKAREIRGRVEREKEALINRLKLLKMASLQVDKKVRAANRRAKEIMKAKAHQIFARNEQEELKRKRSEEQSKLMRKNLERESSVKKSIELKKKDILSKKKCDILLMKLQNSVHFIIYPK